MILSRFFWKLFLGNALLFALIFASSVWLIVHEVDLSYRQDLSRRLRAQAVTIREALKDNFDADHSYRMQSLAAELGAIQSADIRLTIVSQDGTVWADSLADPGKMESHASRPEIIAAMHEGWGEAERFSDTLHREMKYVALRVDVGNMPIGIVRVAMPVLGITAQTDTMHNLIWRIGAVGLFAAIILALGLAYFWSNPIRRITDTARSLSAGDLSARVDVVGRDEIAEMASSLNHMRDSLATQLQTIDRQRQNLEYLIRALTEGVILAGPDGRIVLMNPAALRLLHAAPDEDKNGRHTRTSELDLDNSKLNLFAGQSVEDCIPYPQLRSMLSSSKTRIEGGNIGHNDANGFRELRLDVEQPRGVLHLMARACDIDFTGASAPGGTAGKLVVLTDITELTKTIRMKTDFVANASHELRTPLSAIRASVETLMQMDPATEATSARHFMSVIDRHSSRLEELVGDLLDLSKLEATSAQFPPDDLRLRDFLEELHARFVHALDDKKLHWSTACPWDCEKLYANPHLLRLVLDNLVSNAVKFTNIGGHISVNCERVGNDIRITVADDGCGIPPEDRDRVFERFYQVERARTSDGRQPGQRGTGLGLSIVRHAVAALRGTVSLESELGKGTRVTITLPRAD